MLRPVHVILGVENVGATPPSPAGRHDDIRLQYTYVHVLRSRGDHLRAGSEDDFACVGIAKVAADQR